MKSGESCNANMGAGSSLPLPCTGGKFSEKKEMSRGHLQTALTADTDAKSVLKRQDWGGGLPQLNRAFAEPRSGLPEKCTGWGVRQTPLPPTYDE